MHREMEPCPRLTETLRNLAGSLPGRVEGTIATVKKRRQFESNVMRAAVDMMVLHPKMFVHIIYNTFCTPVTCFGVAFFNVNILFNRIKILGLKISFSSFIVRKKYLNFIPEYKNHKRH